MKVKELVYELNKIIAHYGNDLDMVLSCDEEGNSFSTLSDLSIGLVRKSSDDYNSDVVGVVLYPWEEGFRNPEDACHP